MIKPILLSFFLIININCIADTQTDSRLLVTVGDQQITTQDVNHRLNMMATDTDSLTASSQNQIIDQLIDEAVLIEVAKTLAIDRTEAFAQAVARAKNRVLLTMMLDEVAWNQTVTTADINSFYTANSNLFNAIEQRRYRYTRVDTQSQASTLYAKWQDNPQAIDATSIDGGWLMRADTSADRQSDPVYDAVFSLDTIGSIAPPVPLDGQYMIIQLNGINITPKQSIAASEALIRSEIMRQRHQAAVAAYIADKKATLAIKRY